MAIPMDKGIEQSVHQSKALENISVAYRMPGLIASALSPTVPVKHETDNYYVYDKDNLRLEETVRANGAEANEVKFHLSTATYRLEEHALKDIVTDRTRGNADVAIRMDIDTTENLTDRILHRIEEDLANLAVTKASWSQNHSLSGTAVWSLDTTLSNPIPDINTGSSVIQAATGFIPNVVVMQNPAFLNLQDHVSLIDRMKYTSSESISETLMARLFHVEQVLVGRGIADSAAEGMAESMEYIWTDSAFVGFINRSPGLKKPSAMYTFRKMDKGSPFKVKKWREEKREGDFIEVQTMFQHKIVASSCGYVIVNTA